MEFKIGSQGNLDFINVKTKTKGASGRYPLFLFEDEYYKSESFAIHYFKSIGYDAIFTENKPWNVIVKNLFNDIFKKFKKISKEKKYKYGFYNNEFFEICKDDIDNRVEYLRKVNLIDEVKKHKIHNKVLNKVMTICEYLKKEQILFICYNILQDYTSRHKGFPDLFVFNDEDYYFCEVKAGTDSLMVHQVRAHEIILNSGINIQLFCINKPEAWVNEEKLKYYNEDFFSQTNFKEVYDYKIRTANKIYNELLNENIDSIKDYFLEKYDYDSFLGFLNFLNEYPRKTIEIIKDIDEFTINQSLKEGKNIKNLQFLSKGQYFEVRGWYKKAIEEYKKAKTCHGYHRSIICYRKIKDFENEISMTYHVINDVDDISDESKIRFKSRARRFVKNKNRIKVFRTNNKCPKCGSDEIVTVLEYRNNIKIITCINGSCYWFGGFYKGNLYDYEKLTDLKGIDVDENSKKISFEVMKSYGKRRNNIKKSNKITNHKFENNKSYEENIDIKYNLMLMGNDLIDNGNYGEAIEFYECLLNHELYVNDYHPYLKLSKVYRLSENYSKEAEIISQFFKSGRYCRRSLLKKFINRLYDLSELGYLKESDIKELEEEYASFGAKNRKLSKVPVPLAKNIKAGKKNVNDDKPLKYAPNDFDKIVHIAENATYNEKIKFKYDLIVMGDKFIDKRKYDKAIAFYTRLLSHSLFINDYYPYRKLSIVLRKDKRKKQEVIVLTQFFNSGIYCDKEHLHWFIKRLKQLGRYGNFDVSKIKELEFNFNKKGALNKHLTDKPVPLAIDIKKSMGDD